MSDAAAREQALMNASELYRGVGAIDLSLAAAQRVIDENWAQRGICRGGQQKLAALYDSGRLKTVGAEFQAGTAACEKPPAAIVSCSTVRGASGESSWSADRPRLSACEPECDHPCLDAGPGRNTWRTRGIPESGVRYLAWLMRIGIVALEHQYLVRAQVREVRPAMTCIVLDDANHHGRLGFAGSVHDRIRIDQV